MVHLHLHTHFSFGIGVSSPETLAAAAAERGFGALACTDTNGVYGAVEFQRACEAAGVRPILGAHLVTDDEETVALATDERGWAALCRAITGFIGRMSGRAGERASRREQDRWSRSPARPPRLSALSRPRPRRPPPPLAGRRLSRARPRLSGPRDLYAELVPGKERHAVLAAARRLGLPAVVTNAAVMAHPEDWQRHRLLRAIHLNTTLSALDDPSPPLARPPARLLAPRDAWLRPTDDLARQFPDCPEAVRAADEIAERCRYRIPVGRVVAPRFADANDALEPLRAAGLRRRRAALRHGRAGDRGAAGARARHHRRQGLRRLLPGGAGHRRARPHPLRPRLGRQLDRELLSRHHPRRAARRRAPVRAVPQSRAQGPARHRSRLPLGRARPRAGLRVPALSPSPGRDGGQPQLLPPARRAARGGQGARPPQRRDPRGHPPHPLVRGGAARAAARDPSQLQGARPPAELAGAAPGWPRRWWACRATSRSIRAAWSSCPPRSPTTSPSSRR